MTKIRFVDYVIDQIKAGKFDVIYLGYELNDTPFMITSEDYYATYTHQGYVYGDALRRGATDESSFRIKIEYQRQGLFKKAKAVPVLYRYGKCLGDITDAEKEALLSIYYDAIHTYKTVVRPNLLQAEQERLNSNYWIET